MTPQQPEEMVSLALMEVSEVVLPLVEFAEGQRATLEARGWSPSAAEAAALEVLLALLRASFAPKAKK